MRRLRHSFSSSFLLLLTGLLFAGSAFRTTNSPAKSGQQQLPSRPNIVVILADDLGYGDIGVNGQKLIRTPNIDRLAAEGVRFTQFYAGTSVCSPSRSALLTGQHTGHTYIRGNKSVDPEGQQPIADSVVTIAELLQKAGYTTAAFGKWGLGPVGSAGDPLKQGFDRFYGYNCQSLAHRYYPSHLWNNAEQVVLTDNQNVRNPRQYAPDLIQQQALTFIGTQSSQKPFFLFLPYTLPHAELLVPDDSIFQSYKGRFAEQPYKGTDYGPGATSGGYTSQPYPRATFAAMVTRLDLYVGQVLAKLTEQGLDKNTLVIFSSDNGPHIEGGADPVFFNSGGGFRGVKRDLYEGGIREPFIVRWPGTISPGTRSEHIGAFWDLLPTFAELAGVKNQPPTDGISFVPALTGNGTQRHHDYLYWEFHEQGGKQAIRQGNWKAVRLTAATQPDAPLELYDLATDPSEKRNLASQHPDRVKQLGQLMNQAHQPSPLFPFGTEGR